MHPNCFVWVCFWWGWVGRGSVRRKAVPYFNLAFRQQHTCLHNNNIETLPQRDCDNKITLCNLLLEAALGRPCCDMPQPGRHNNQPTRAWCNQLLAESIGVITLLEEQLGANDTWK